MNSYYNRVLAEVEDVLSGTLPSEDLLGWAELNTGCDVSAVADNTLREINRPALDLLSRGGKRWRPVLMCLACRLYGGEDRALSLTPLVEFPHNGSLIVDDIEDGSDTRRGRPAVHMIYGIDTAINTGNFIYFQPLVLLETMELDPAIKLRLYSYYGQAMRRLHFGQGMDISWHGTPDFFPEKDAYLRMCLFKTGSLSGLAGRAGTALAGASGEESLFFGELMEKMGIAFQILDDVRNLTTGNPGKKRGDDIVEGKKSLPVILFARKHPEEKTRLAELFRRAGELGIEKGTAQVDEALRLLLDSGVVNEAREEAEGMLQDVKSDLEKKFSPSEPLEAVVAMLDSFLS